MVTEQARTHAERRYGKNNERMVLKYIDLTLKLYVSF